ncbi:oligopeptide ABC transporter permease [Cohnella lupini]|uniref:Peptide/nickel transport system permease protein n=1 Tax=Cohnella lupini TaxID=1294267 RepID=A0A3D9IXW8_9BACL|nr:oligopeptide ABC transporter permease [Cohnella lupini]RED65936.1 peptide/nickel transport system permease protein [Cohnella lupini]
MEMTQQGGVSEAKRGSGETSGARQAWRRYKKNKLAMFGLGFIVLLVLISLSAPLLAPHSPFNSIKNAAGSLDIMAKPSHEYLLGTDSLGRDVFARLMYAGRISLSVGIVSVTISTLLGVLLGSIAGYYGKWIDSVIMRIVDVIYCFPVMFLIITVSALLKPSIYNVMIIIGLVSWTSTARLVRGEILRVRELEYIQASKALGVKDFSIIVQHIIPNIMAPILVQATLMTADAILTEAALSFLGVGVQQPTPSWGNMLNEAMSIMVLRFKYWIWLYPGLAILLTVLSINFIGDGLRDALDPKLKGRK